MGAGGGIQNMIDSYRNNMRMLRKSRLFKKGNTIFENNDISSHSGDQKLVYKKADKVWLEKFRQKLIKEKRIEMIRTTIFFLILLLAVTFLVIRFSGVSFSRTKHDMLEQQQAAYRDQKARYDYYIGLGDEWLFKKNWQFAISDYQMAARILPDEYEAKFKLARAFVYACLETNYNCQEAVNMLAELKQQYPDKKEIFELMAEYYTGIGNESELRHIYDHINR